MALNLSRGKAAKYYRSDRIAQLLGNGLLTFVDEKTQFKDFLEDKHLVYYSNIDDLSYKINKYKKDTLLKRKIAKNGSQFYLKYYVI